MLLNASQKSRVTNRCLSALGTQQLLKDQTVLLNSSLVSKRHKTNALGIAAYSSPPGGGWASTYIITTIRPDWKPIKEVEYETAPRDEMGVPVQIPPEVSTKIRQCYSVRPQFFPFIKKLGDDTPAIKPYTDKLIRGELTFIEFEEMFYKCTKPLKIYRELLNMPFRTAEEQAKSEEVDWEGYWLSYRQRIRGDYSIKHQTRHWLVGLGIGIYWMHLWVQANRQYRIDMKLFYIEAPEHKINWVLPRGDI
eukprot:GHVL01014545.1.p1 GENE.GHVL01014545.1~~GHVL01014545.1.p1  ORF type:complete len:250 (+),score=18.58 GHVL01014545.1:63-812(+)